MKEVKNRDKWLFMFVVVVAVFLGLSLISGCGTVRATGELISAAGGDLSDAAEGYSIEAGRRAERRSLDRQAAVHFYRGANEQIVLRQPVVSD